MSCYINLHLNKLQDKASAFTQKRKFLLIERVTEQVTEEEWKKVVEMSYIFGRQRFVVGLSILVFHVVLYKEIIITDNRSNLDEIHGSVHDYKSLLL